MLCRSPLDRVAASSAAFFFFQAEDGIRDWSVTGVQTCALPISTAALNPAKDCVYVMDPAGANARSEEHTSELQSLTNLVCRLLLEKKKGMTNPRVAHGSVNTKTRQSAISIATAQQTQTISNYCS